MIDNSMFIEKFLQTYRFNLVKPYLLGDVLDFGGNKGELSQFVKGRYRLVNYDHAALADAHFDTIASLAVLEHIDVNGVYGIFQKFKAILNPGGRIVITTPTPIARPILEFMAWLGLVDKDNIVEHKHYWNKKDLNDLAAQTGFVVEKYKKFQIGFNQLIVLAHE